MAQNRPGPAYRILTPRLVIRCWNPVDAPLLKEAVDSSIDHLKPFMPWAHQEPTPLVVARPSADGFTAVGRSNLPHS
jgi:hypothetical protein